MMKGEKPIRINPLNSTKKQLEIANNRIAELEAIVAKLPLTADGVPVVPMTDSVWGISHHGNVLKMTVWANGLAAPMATLERWTVPVSECYSTEQAALDAQGKE